MERVIKPVQLPPVIDKFCHLSVDAQKVISAIYKQFEKEKENILISQMDRQSSQGIFFYLYVVSKSQLQNICIPNRMEE